MMGDSEKGEKYLGGAIIGAIILAALTVLIPALVGWRLRYEDIETVFQYIFNSFS